MILSEEIELLAAEFHEVYQQELKRQGVTNRHSDNYSDLPEGIKDIDRALAVFVQGKLDASVAAAYRVAAMECDKRDNLPTEIQRRILALATLAQSHALEMVVAEVVWKESEWWHESNCNNGACCAREKDVVANLERLRVHPERSKAG